jgi:hypothetical protein
VVLKVSKARKGSAASRDYLVTKVTPATPALRGQPAIRVRLVILDFWGRKGSGDSRVRPATRGRLVSRDFKALKASRDPRGSAVSRASPVTVVHKVSSVIRVPLVS